MTDDEINYKYLRRIQQVEQNSPLLSLLDSHFYEKLSEYLFRLDTIAVEEKNQQKQKLLQEEIQNIRKIVMNIYEQREKKLVYAALSASRGGKPELKNLVSTERQLYDGLIRLITNARDTLIIKHPLEQKEHQIVPEKPLSLSVPQSGQNLNPIVRVLIDIPAFLGTDMKTYVLQKDDVLSLEKEMADLLQKRGVIQHLK